MSLRPLPQKDEMIRVFSDCTLLRTDSEHLIELTEQLRRNALNIEILSCNSGSNAPGVAVIAQEFSRLALKVNGLVNSLLARVSKISDAALFGSVRARLCHVYQITLQRSVPEESFERIAGTREKMGDEMMVVLSEVYDGLREAMFDMNDLKRLSVHIPVVATMMRIESRNCPQEAAVQLEVLASRLIELGETLVNTVGVIRERAEGIGLADMLNAYAAHRVF